MTPKEQADKLIASFSLAILSEIGHELNMTKVKGISRASALIAVDKILDYQNQLLKNYKVELKDTYWEQVKKELEVL
jgi:hypothetical protein